jgi:TPR repeat protein
MINKDLEKKAESGDPAVMRELAFEYLREAKECGKGGKSDKKLVLKALDWMGKSASKGDAEAQHEMADILRREEDYEMAFKFEKSSAEQGYIPAYYNLALHYQDGIGTDVDPEMTFYWCNKAVESGDVEGKSFLGTCYWLGTGTEKDFEKAFFWINQAADEGSAAAKRKLGLAYTEGLMRLKVDEEKGWALLQEAADMGDEEAIERIKLKKKKK